MKTLLKTTKKKIQNRSTKLLFVLFLFQVHQVYGEAWIDMSYEQALEVQKLLKRNPFVLDYCDCCSKRDVYLLKIMNTEIVTCPNDGSKFSVNTKSVRIAKLAQGDGRVDVSQTIPFEYSEERLVEYCISMNYTFIYKKVSNTCAPIYRVIEYDDRDRAKCEGIGLYPNPFHHKIEIHDNDYKKWTKKRLKFG